MSAFPDRAAAILDRLVAFDTTSHKPNIELIEYVASYLGEHGVEARVVSGPSTGKADLLATIGPRDVAGIVLSGHTDVVPAVAEDWTDPPFRLAERDGKLFGRGTADMKGFIALVLARVPELLASDLKAPVHLAFSYDEEVGCLGVRELIPVLATLPVRPRLCIVGEPTGMSVVNGHKGKFAFRTRVRGLGCHSGLAPQGVNAVEYAAELIAHMKQMARRFAADGPFEEGFGVPHSTVHVGTIQGGTALNIVPDECVFDWEIRYIPAHDGAAIAEDVRSFARDSLEPRMQTVSKACGIDFDTTIDYPGLQIPADDDAVQFVQGLAGTNALGKVDFGTEAGLFQRDAGIPTVVCGPGYISDAHKPDEFIAKDQFAAGDRFLERLTARLIAGGVPR
ncbi:acetylornithine deacetylase [Oceanibacterium hippocampi]|uniref:Acetylornithine deacetylase n=1 Tax=Oceanibacterium hippocampi TaxID=745714 RepID=A0A1Y5TID4_9PROT|nr:acetylornithine deacetylase [Oceanibacterium hippocampi]SLN64391.1 Acetylornithine deacetylase [Oceanibacterium hippocampi]